VQACHLSSRVEQVERDRGDQQPQGAGTGGPQQQPARRSQVDPQTSRTDGNTTAENSEGPLRPLMADERESALQSQANRQKTVA